MTAEEILQYLEERNYKELKEKLESMHPVDIAQILEEVTEKQVALVFRLLAKEEAAETFSYMNNDMRENLIGALIPSLRKSLRRCT